MHRRSAKGRYAKPLAALKRDVTGNSVGKETAIFEIANTLKWGAPPRVQYSCPLYGPLIHQPITFLSGCAVGVVMMGQMARMLERAARRACSSWSSPRFGS